MLGDNNCSPPDTLVNILIRVFIEEERPARGSLSCLSAPGSICERLSSRLCVGLAARAILAASWEASSSDSTTKKRKPQFALAKTGAQHQELWRLPDPGSPNCGSERTLGSHCKQGKGKTSKWLLRR
ncbi:hypothetical protein AV530_018368 [Patagioenas fasciata monilis]|uniref:Uncharacterized protein n=1 Tax=Patagioenas fasciata monilis TaxID=372326 RepID=A0A1V4JRM8_PATFA|nr:hypothetical protein AV530_018368 [Patagioenas fasciata monilis]